MDLVGEGEGWTSLAAKATDTEINISVISGPPYAEGSMWGRGDFYS
jgi:hypothetical protein